jgi:phosphatidylinositol alpha 1,6-mannosyltransferase
MFQMEETKDNSSHKAESFASLHGLPFLTVYGGSKDTLELSGSLLRMERRRGRIGFPLDKKHYFDLAFWRHYKAIHQAVRQFQPDVIHITGPSDLGQLGALLAHRLHIPLAASWHTNVHQYAEQRASRLLSLLPEGWKTKLGAAIRQASLQATLRFYRIPRFLFAPNQELIELLEKGTGKACYPMGRGVDTHLFDPSRRDRTDNHLVLGYVGRLTTEKNIRYLVDIERNLEQAGVTNFRFLIVGQGGEEPWLKTNLRRAEFAGVLKYEALASAYANMDIFVFPSMTDTYGNVVLEAMPSGVPAVVTASGGPRFIVCPGETGHVAQDVKGFVSCIKAMIENHGQLARMREAARAQALRTSWDQVFESVYARYEKELALGATGKDRQVRPQARVAASPLG